MNPSRLLAVLCCLLLTLSASAALAIPAITNAAEAHEVLSYSPQMIEVHQDLFIKVVSRPLKTSEISSGSHASSTVTQPKSRVGCLAPSWVEQRLVSSHPILVEKGGTTLVHVPGFQPTTIPSLPVLPSKFVLIAIPPNARFVGLEVVSDDAVSLGRVRGIPYFVGVRVRYADGKTVPVSPKALDSFYPADIVEVEQVGILGNLRVVGVRFWPVQWHPLTGHLLWHRSVVIRIHYTPWLPLLKPYHETGSFDAVARSLVINYRQAVQNNWFAHIPIVVPGGIPYKDGHRAWLLVERPGAPGYFATESLRVNSDDDCDICIIANDVSDPNIYDAFYQLKLWKEARGTLRVNITRLSNIFSIYGESPDGIRNFLIDAKNTWPSLKWVILGYDCRQDPKTSGTWWVYTNVYYDSGSIIPSPEPRVSDIPFAHLDVTLNPDGDQYIHDNGDVWSNYIPDVFVGRAVCNNATQAWNVVKKVIFYEGTVNHHAALVGGAYLAASDDGPSAVFFCLYHYVHRDPNVDPPNAFQPWNSYWETAHPDYELYDYLANSAYGSNWTGRTSMVNALNEFNYSVIGYATHGSEASNWLYDGRRTWVRGFSTTDVGSLTTIHGWYVTLACLTGCWDNTEQGPIYSDSGDCLAEVLTSGYDDRGAVCTHAATESQWGWSGSSSDYNSSSIAPSAIYPVVDGLAGGLFCLEYKILFQCGYGSMLGIRSYPSQITGYLTVGEVFHWCKYYYTTHALGHSTWDATDRIEHAEWNIVNLLGDPSLDPIRAVTFFKNFATTPSTVQSGDTVTISGRLVTGYAYNSATGYWEPGNIGVGGRTVKVYVSTDLSSWSLVDTAVTGADGSWSVTWTAPNVASDTTYYFYAEFEGDDIYVNSKTTSYASVVVQPAGDTTPPTVTITSPTDGAYLNTPDVTVQWTSSDNTGVAEHEVWVDGSLYADNLPGTQTSYTVTGLGEGSHTIEVKAYDAAGNVGSDSITITVDLTAPSVTITSPSDGAYLATQDVTVSWTSSDNEGIDHYDLYLDGGYVTTVDASTTSYTFSGLPEGSHEVNVTAIDLAGNVASDIVSFTIDLTTPSVTITSPTDGSYLATRDVTVQWTGSDNYGIDHYEVRLYNSTWDSGWINVGTTTSYTFTSLSEGTYTANVTAYDLAGNYAYDTVSFTIDLSNPSITITSPSDGAYLATQDVTVQWSCSDNYGVDHYDLYLDGGYVTTVDASTTSYTFTGLPEGSHEVNVTAVDLSGNVASDTVTFTVDITPPSISITSPTDGSTVSSTTVTVEWSGSDNILLDHYELRYYNATYDSGWINVGTATSYTLTRLSDGSTYTVNVTAYDAAGNTAYDAITFTVQLQAGQPPTVTIAYPANNSYVPDSSVNVTWQGDDDTGIDHYEVRLYNSTWDSGWINTGLQTWYEFTGLSETEYWVEVNATDVDDLWNVTKHRFWIDLTPPTVTITNPADGSFFNTTSVTVQWSGSDNYGIDHYNLFLNGSLITTLDATTTSYTLTGLSEGTYQVTVEAVDVAGWTTTDQVSFTIDLTAPTVTITSPADGSYWNTRSITVSWTGSDNYVLDHYEVRLYNSTWDSGWIDVGLATSYTFTNLGEGQYNATVKAVDAAGNVATDQVSFTIDLTPPTVTITDPSDGATLTTNDVTVQWTASDNYGIDFYDLYLDNQYVTTVDGTTTSYTFIDLPSGTHNVTVVAYDLALNYNNDTVTFTVQVPITVTITAPPYGTYQPTQDVTVQWTIDTTDVVTAQYIRIDWGPWISLAADVRSYTFTGLGESQHWVQVNATISSGDWDIDTVMFYVDTSPPAVTIRSPADGAYINTDAITVSWNATDRLAPFNLTLSLDGAVVATDLPSNTTHYTLTGLTEGTHTIQLNATDAAGWTTSVTITITIDLTSPTVSITSPTEGAVLGSSDVTVQWSSSDNYGIDHYEIWLDGSLTDTVDAATTSYTLTGLSDGTHTVEIVAVDVAGNTASAVVHFTVDTTAPWIQITSPSDGATISVTTIRLVWVAGDNVAIDHYEVYVDGTLVWTGTERTTLVQDLTSGTHTIQVTAIDTAGNTATDTITITIS